TPDVAPAGTYASIVEADSATKVVGVPLNVTCSTSAKSLPLIVTRVPSGPESGLKPDTDGGAGGTMTANAWAVLALPCGDVTVIGPLVAAGGTTAWMDVDESTVNDAGVPLNCTADTPDRPVPVIVTTVPAVPERGAKEVIVNACDCASSMTLWK